MIICDVCKSLKNKAFEVQIQVSKMEEYKTRAKPTEKVIVTIPVHLCEGCITNFNSRLGHFINQIRREIPKDSDVQPVKEQT